MRQSFTLSARPARTAYLPLVAATVLCLLLGMSATPAQAQDIIYTFSGSIRVLDLASPPPGSGTEIPGLDPLGLDGAVVVLTCVIDSATPPSATGPNGDGTFAFYNAGIATLAITGSVGGAVDGTYVEPTCSVRVDDFPIGSIYGGDVLAVTTKWNLGMPFPDVFQVPFAQLGDDTFTGAGLQTFAASEVVGFIGVNFAGSNDVFYFDVGSGTALGVSAVVDPAQRISDLIDTVEALPGLNRGQKRSLTAKLGNALRLLDKGRERPAIRLLAAFVRRVEALVRSGKMAGADAQMLIDEANSIAEQIRAG